MNVLKDKGFINYYGMSKSDLTVDTLPTSYRYAEIRDGIYTDAYNWLGSPAI